MTGRDKRVLTTNEAANYLGYKATTLRNSRLSGRLAGVQAPRYWKIGAGVRYEKTELDRWLGQFPVQASTSSTVAQND